MTNYKKVSGEMYKDIDLLVEKVRANNGDMPSEWLEEKYKCDTIALSYIAIGILAWSKPNVRVNSEYAEIAREMVSDGKILVQAQYDNYGEIPSELLRDRYNDDPSVLGKIAIGVIAFRQSIEN